MKWDSFIGFIKGKGTYVRLNVEPIEFKIPVGLKSLDGSDNEKEIMFTVQRWGYEDKYRFPLFNVCYYVYQIHCDLPEEINDKIKDHYRQTMSVPRLLSWFYNEEAQLQAVIGFFLDIKMAEIPVIDK